jgi:transposase
MASFDNLSYFVDHLPKIMCSCYFREKSKAEDYIAFLKAVDKKCGAGKVLHIIADNYPTHKTKKAKEYFESVPGRFEAHFIPTHSSWLNMVERWFGEITNKGYGGRVGEVLKN